MSIFTSVIKCGICGEPLSGAGNPYTCAVCGNVSYTSNPMLEDELRTANAMRECTRFDEAMLVYKQIVKKYKTDDLSEVYWNLLLCEQRVMFETDEKGERFPSFYAITDDEIEDSLYYLGAIGSAEKHAPERVEIFKGLAEKMIRAKQLYARISETSKPYDLFICFKKSAFEGGDTKDCALAIDLYNHLAKDYNIFFSERSLKNVVVREFEPNIYYGLYTAKVMLVLCSKKEYVESQWVKNEWSRFHAFAQNPATGKTIIPIFLEDFSPRSLPSELISYQGLSADYHLFDELGKTLRKIIKPVDMESELKRQLAEQQRRIEEQQRQEAERAEAQRHQMEEQQRQMQEQLEAMRRTQKQAGSATSNAPSNDIAPLLRRAFMFAEDKKWDSANEYFEKVLDRDPENADAYLGKLMVEMKVTRQEQLRDCAEPFDRSNHYQKAMRFADHTLKSTLADYIKHIKDRNEKARIAGIYDRAKKAMLAASTESAYKEAAKLFESISAHMDSAALAQECHEKAEVARKDAILADGKAKMAGKRILNYEVAIKLFRSIAGWKDADKLCDDCVKKVEALRAKTEAECMERERLAEEARIKSKKRAKRNQRIAITAISVACAVIAFIIVLNAVIIPQRKKNDFIALYGQEIYDKFGLVAENEYITFGTYEQDNNTSNGKEAIEWLVLEVKDGKALVISKYALDCRPYHASLADIVWETCSLREWLNSGFVNTAFTAEEKTMISTVTVSAAINPSYSTNPGNATQDKAFLLSIAEVEKYFNSDRARQCKPTAHTVANGAYVYSNGNCHWWLRSPGSDQNLAAYVGGGGIVEEHGFNVGPDYGNVRPAMWIDLNA